MLQLHHTADSATPPAPPLCRPCGSAPPVAWAFLNMRLLAVIGGAIAAAGIALMSGLAMMDCCFERAAKKKVAAA